MSNVKLNLVSIFNKHINTSDKSKLDNRKPITIWVSAETKASYDSLQAKTSSKFSKALNEVINTTINDAKKFLEPKP